MENYAIASRSLERAQAFKEQYVFQKAYGSYEEAAADPLTDLVYIATPHSEHLSGMKLALKYRKPVLCEKAFTANQKEAEEAIFSFEKAHVFLTEAIWTRYFPARKTLDEILASGIIGEPYLLSANLCYPNKNHARLTDPSLAGGALLDMGIYPLTFALMVFQSYPLSVQASCSYTETGVDETDTAVLTFPQGRRALIYASMDGPSDRSGFIYGRLGYIQVININNTERIDVFNQEHQLVKSTKIPQGISGYEWELYACEKALKERRISCPEIPHEDTLKVMGLLDEMRRQMKIVYPFEK
jgi:predicted dehydrogenase